MDNQQLPSLDAAGTPSQPKGHRSLTMWLMLFIGLAVGAGIVVAVWLYWPKPAAQSPTQTANSSSSSTPSPAPAATTTVANCQLNDLSMSVGKTDGTAGTIYQHMVLKNKSSASCVLAGYPAVFMADAGGTILGSGAVPSPTPAPITLTLTAGAEAYTAVGFPEAGNFDPGTCSATAASIRVYIPGTAAYLESPLAKANCPGFSSTAFASGS